MARYRGKLSGPLLDRIDVQIEVPSLREDELLAQRDGESSAAVRERVQKARHRQSVRGAVCNAQLAVRDVESICRTDETGQALLRQAFSRLNLSARGYHRILKLGRTIADLAGAESVGAAHLAEAIQYRRMDRAAPSL